MFYKSGYGYEMVAQKGQVGQELKNLWEAPVPEQLAPPNTGQGRSHRAHPTLTQAWGFFKFYFKSLDSFNIQVVAKSGHV